MWFWMGNLQQRKKTNILWYIGLCLSLNFVRLILWQLRRYLGYWSARLLNVDRQGSFLSYQSKRNDEEHNERTCILTKCEFSFPQEMSVNAKYFIKKALKRNPDERFTISSLLQDKFLSGCSQRHWKYNNCLLYCFFILPILTNNINLQTGKLINYRDIINKNVYSFSIYPNQSYSFFCKLSDCFGNS